MSKALITEDYLTDIADAIRAKNGSSDTYTPPQMAAAIAAIPTGGGAPLLYRLGGFFGDVTALVSSLNATLSGTIGETAILIVEHRTAINVTGGMTLIDTSRGSGDFAQYISVYTKVLTSATETVTITTTDTSSTILAAATVYFNRPLTIGAPVQQQMDTGVSNYRYTIPPSQHMRLAVVNNPYAANNSTHTIEKTRYVLPSNFIGSQALTFRLIVFIIYDLNENVVLDIGTNYAEADYLNNRIYLYDIE